ncbi:iron-containing alcohol dehydrogenase [Chloroflexota bacterium]
MISRFYIPVRLVFGDGAIDQLGEEAKAIGKKALIVTYPDIRKVGLLDRVEKNLKENGVDTLAFEEVEPNPRSSTIDRGADIVRKEKVDLVIGLGGGSAMDAAKGIATASSGKTSVWDYVIKKSGVTGSVPSLIQVPTMAGTGSEMNAVAIISNWETHEKSALMNPCQWAKVSIVDPAITVTVPRNQTAAGGVDTFSHLVEYYCMPESPLPLNDAYREAVLKIVVKYLPKALANLDDLEARIQLSWASTIAMSNLAQLGGTVGFMTCHGIEHAVSGKYDVTHGAGLAALLPAWMRSILPVRKARLDMLGKNVFGKSDGIKAFEEWLEEVGMRVRLRDMGCEPEAADEIADLTIRTFPALNLHPTKLDAEAIARIYRESC